VIPVNEITYKDITECKLVVKCMKTKMVFLAKNEMVTIMET